MAESRDQFLARRKQELFGDLKVAHDLLTDYQDEHNKTGYGCVRSGHCCQVGLQLHYMECEYIAKNILEMTGGDEDLLEPFIDRLEAALEDNKWTWGSSIGNDMCAFFEDGCTIYPVRPSICRMYGVLLETDEFCPREKLASGDSYVYVQKDVDRLVAAYYKSLDNYGRLFPERDYTVYMPRGVLEFLATPERLKKLKAKTAKKFWKREKGYRTQFKASYRQTPALQTNVKFPFAIPPK